MSRLMVMVTVMKTEGMVIDVAMMVAVIILVTSVAVLTHHDQRQLKKEYLFRIFIPEG